ncbi:NADP-dependent oxidoreductase domain-containing protein [Lipomyces orientalis]|uniref:NADP-dependent oxidoreductase domain-containing protein n=1 Tax=Lipomyces orientalis TaxID=1233043 RepID=A0ACC3TGS1_9ASCO
MATGRYFTLNTGAHIPALGLGTWRSPTKEVYAAVSTALKRGYRHIDTALIYGNETPVGQAIRNSQIAREQIFLTTKLWNTYHTMVPKGFEDSLKHLGLDYVDLYLMHWPVSMDKDSKALPESEWDFVKTWAEMQKLVDSGLVKAIGVSNFSTKNLQRLLDAESTKIVPAANQVELHPFNPQHKLLRYCADHDIHLTAYSPLGSNTGPLQEEPAIMDMAAKYNKSAAQVLISWAIQRGTSVIPKSVTQSRIKQNFEDFALEDGDFEALNELCQKKTVRIVDPQWGVNVFNSDDN